ncbi:hypothetical protein SAMN04488101_101203 [Pedobacter nyackensis]|uniref:Uncharacterized protein n=1 Tax=Pedobacter nyackensis TaxID=475255 RepID=A0A1W2A0Y4_9SPHI|nr:hypothetical protein SAMN04488101_101203 [Pedobacter nyackensis]
MIFLNKLTYIPTTNSKQQVNIPKTALAVWHSGARGKTQTVREFANFLLTSYPHYKPIFPLPALAPPVGDFRLVVEINGVIVGVESQGDPHTGLKDRLIDLADNYHCDIIISTSRTRGETVIAVDHLHYSKGFQIIWTSTYQISGTVKLVTSTHFKKFRHKRSGGHHLIIVLLNRVEVAPVSDVAALDWTYQRERSSFSLFAYS